MSNFEKFKKELPNKDELSNSLPEKKNFQKEYEHVFNVWKKFEMKTIKDYHVCGILLLGDLFEKSSNNSLKIMDYVRVII